MSEIIREDPRLRRSLGSWKIAGIVVFLLLVVAFPLYKAVEDTRRADATAAEQAALLRMGSEVWGLNCASCHGIMGQGVDAPALNSQEFLSSVSDEQMHGIITGGIPGTEMPAWWNEFGGPLTDQQIQAIVTYVRSWEANAPSVPDWRSPHGAMGAHADGGMG